MKVYWGKLVHSVAPDKDIQVLEDRLLGVDDSSGKILFVEAASRLAQLAEKHGFTTDSVVRLTESQFLMPGLVDTHIHAPQYVNSGTGYDLMLLDWLDKYTFPTEANFKDLDYAKDVYTKAVKRTLLHGTTTASYFATIHLEPTKELCRIIEQMGQRALVGKVNMDTASPEFYVETTEASIEDTRKFIEFVKGMNNPLVQAVVTPRFAPSCTTGLLRALGELATKYDVPIQSHMCEQIPEIEYTMKLFPKYKTTGDIFEDTKLLTSKTYMAHCIHMKDSELEQFQKSDVGVAHCPTSNLNLHSGLLDARKLLDKDIKIGLGTDISGGHCPSVLSAMRAAIDISRAYSFRSHVDSSAIPPDYKVLSHHHTFYMATLGGARVLSLDDKIGNFVVGKEFDALLIDTLAPTQDNPVFDTFDQDSFDDILMKFLYLGDDRNILKRFVAGKEIVL